MTVPLCSVVIPSHNRRASLDMVLRALASQSTPPSSFEVAVVLDGGRDGSDELLRTWERIGPLRLKWAWQERAGQATARNKGVEMTSAPVILFLDDDVVPEPDLLRKHLRNHVRGERVAVLGDCPVVRGESPSLHALGVWAWWQDTYHRRGLPGHQTTYRDFCTGNASVRREDFVDVGGFDSAFRGYGAEDYELGYRLLRSGVRFVVDRDAVAKHHYTASVDRVLAASRDEGAADVLLGERHPELRPGLRLMWPTHLREFSPAFLAVRAPLLGDLVTARRRLMLPVYERMKRRHHWITAFGFARSYAYWRGVADALGSHAALRAYQEDAPPLPEQEIDITNGLPDPLPPLWVHGPSRLIVTGAGRRLGEIRLDGRVEEPLHAKLVREISNQLKLPLVALLAGLDPMPWPEAMPAGTSIAGSGSRSAGFGA